MRVTASGIEIDVRLEQPEKAWSAMLVMDPGITIAETCDPAQKYCGTIVTESGITTEDVAQCAKAFGDRLVTELGIAICALPEQGTHSTCTPRGYDAPLVPNP